MFQNQSKTNPTPVSNLSAQQATRRDFIKAKNALKEDPANQSFLMEQTAELCADYTEQPFSKNRDRFRTFFDECQRKGVHVLKNHFYSPIPDLSRIDSTQGDTVSPLHGVRIETDHIRQLVEKVFPSYKDELAAIPHLQPLDFTKHPQYYLDNSAFSGTDAMATYCLLRELKPKRIIEVGSGFSTLLMSKALEANRLGQITCVEPYPASFLEKPIAAVKELVRSPVQALSANFFDLEAGDMLFIDSTHVAKFGSDVNHLFFNILPQLKRGVYVHVHDVYLPFEVPFRWMEEDKIFWNEQYLLLAFLMFNDSFRITYSNMIAHRLMGDAFVQAFPSANWHGGGSIFLQRDA